MTGYYLYRRTPYPSHSRVSEAPLLLTEGSCFGPWETAYEAAKTIEQESKDPDHFHLMKDV
jgi:hypothetical protein